MVWKILSGIAAVCLAVSAYFSFDNGKKLKTELELAARAEKDLATLRGRKEEGDEVQKNKIAHLETKTKELEETKAKVVKAAADSQEKDAALQLAKNTLDQVTQQVSTIQKKIDELGDVEKLLAQVEALKKEQLAAEGELANQSQQLATRQERVTSLQAETAKLRDYQSRATKGIVEPDFSARVASVFGDWGFVILNKGNAAGIFANANLEVKRGQDVIAKLKVRNVEQQISVADVIPGSVAEGQFLRSGDMVVASASQATATAAPAPTAPSVGGPATPAAPAMDGAAPAAPAPAAGMSDPFGAPAPAAPATPPAGGMSTDPFGAAPAAPATPAAPAMGSDPFGAPATPPAAGGAGTKASPSTADPFGAAPATPPATPPAGGAAKDPFAP
jgi:hypothetical protein